MSVSIIAVATCGCVLGVLTLVVTYIHKTTLAYTLMLMSVSSILC